jgi:hypothetical protein
MKTLKGPGLNAARALWAAAALVFGLARTVAAADGATLVGVIRDPDNYPLPDASVFVFSAKPRHGAATVMASSYPACGKRARTDAEGQFQIPGVDSELIYRLLVVAAGHRPHFITNADPSGAILKAKLRPRKFPDVELENQIIGKVIDSSGNPVGGLSVTLEAITKGNGTRYGGGSNTSIDSSVATDDNGEFLFNAVEPLDSIMVTIDGPRIAKHRVSLDRGKAHLIRVNAGITVAGRLRHEGKPMAGVKVAMATEDRGAGNFLRGFEVATDREGQFAIQAVPADNRFFLYAKMSDMRETGLSLPLQTVNSGAVGSKIDLGDLPLKPAYRIRGRVVMEGDAPLPPKTRLYLSRENAWDTADVVLPPDGSFEFKAVPAEPISLSVRVANYRVSAKNPSKDWLNEGRLLGRLEQDLEDFIIHLEPGARFDRAEGPADNERYPRDKPLRGARLK